GEIKRGISPRLKAQELQQVGKVAQRLKGLDGFFLVCAKFDWMQPEQTSVNFNDLYEELVKLPCHKLVFLDTCHSGSIPRTGTVTNPIRALTKTGVGPVIMAACQPDEEAMESPLWFQDYRISGLFHAALRKTLDEPKLQDRNQNGYLEPGEI